MCCLPAGADADADADAGAGAGATEDSKSITLNVGTVLALEKLLLNGKRANPHF